MSKNYLIADMTRIDAVPCPCGKARRAFALPENDTATVHLVDIRADARAHYHKQHSEIYVVLDGEGFIELDGEKVPIRPMMTVLIKPGCRHRALGRLRILNFVVPPFDSQDEWFD